ncbi:Vms1/Ankzf1 family peptidyl-tRNA hydrolase [Haloplanus sp. GCM10025708]|uniref:Vms1/Ankzf1 family peptidyl-tRNA hydrolase n=1 Tax=Haloferacaceae TaxID=1644056 RepID=UPI003611EC89
MLDELLGRAELKARIEELEEEKHHLERQLDAESERRSEAVTERQEAEERINRLEDRIEQLEDELDQQAAETTLDFRRRESLRGDRLAAVLDRLRSVDAGPEGALTAMVDDAVPDPVRDLLGDDAALVERAAPCLACVDDARLVSVALTPPLAPDTFVEWGERFRLDESWFRPVGRLAFALVRSDQFAFGVYEDGERRDLETVESDVKGSHSKGGFSQSRFERRREEQIAAHLDECREVLDRRDPDRLVLVGDREMVAELDGDADYTAAVDASGDPEAALDDAFRSFFTTRLAVV